MASLVQAAAMLPTSAGVCCRKSVCQCATAVRSVQASRTKATAQEACVQLDKELFIQPVQATVCKLQPAWWTAAAAFFKLLPGHLELTCPCASAVLQLKGGQCSTWHQLVVGSTVSGIVWLKQHRHGTTDHDCINQPLTLCPVCAAPLVLDPPGNRPQRYVWLHPFVKQLASCLLHHAMADAACWHDMCLHALRHTLLEKMATSSTVHMQQPGVHVIPQLMCVPLHMQDLCCTMAPTTCSTSTCPTALAGR